MDKTYKRAVELLTRRKRPARSSIKPAETFSIASQISSSIETPRLKGKPPLTGMRNWLDELGHSSKKIDSLNIIHVAGTKGKGSTCAYIDSFLKAHGRRTGFPKKVGLYTSPFLIRPEEIIRINSQPLSQDLFAKYFFEVDDIIERATVRSIETRPRKLQFSALLAFHAFIREGVDAAIIETHHGGEYDATNVIENPLVTAVTTLGLDHTNQLGSSIESIAWHKGGIFKTSAPALSAPQEFAAAEVLRKRASDKGVHLQFVDWDPSVTDNMQLVDVQRTNSSLALAAVRSFLDRMGDGKLSKFNLSDTQEGLSQFSWPGRFQIVVEDQLQWFLDGAHNELSIGVAADWFRKISQQQKIAPPVTQILIFSSITNQRNGALVFARLVAQLGSSRIQHLILTTYAKDKDGSDPGPVILEPISGNPEVYADIWKSARPDSDIRFEPTIEGALESAREIGRRHGTTQVLVTGSLHLIGGALDLLEDKKRGIHCLRPTIGTNI